MVVKRSVYISKPLGSAFVSWFSAFLGIGVATLMRSNAFVAAIVFLFSNSGGWKHFGSTVTAYDFWWAAQISAWTRSSEQPLVIAIDDQAYRAFFNGHSPVSRSQMLDLLRVVQDHTAADTRVAIDIDLSPGPEDRSAQQSLDAFLGEQAGRWVLPAVQGESSAQSQSLRDWRETLCHRGLQFGLPYVPTEFGLPRLTHQYAHSLGHALVHPKSNCLDPEAPLSQQPMPLSAWSLKHPDVLVFRGDLVSLGQALDKRRPRAVVVGGTWGLDDRFDTPLGERFGVQLHAAAIAGSWQSERLSPRIGELLSQWSCLALMAVVLFYLSQVLNRLTSDFPQKGAGVLFFEQVGKPMLMTAVMVCCLGAWVTASACLHAWSGLWISSLQVCTVVPIVMIVVWNYGRAPIALFSGVRGALNTTVGTPIRADCRSIRKAYCVLRQESGAGVTHGADPWLTQPRWRVGFELAAASVSLLVQNGLPLLGTMYLIYKAIE